jgi:hypothetical protein
MTADKILKNHLEIDEYNHIIWRKGVVEQAMKEYAKEMIKLDRLNVVENVKIRKDYLDPVDDDKVKSTEYRNHFFEDIGYEDYIPVDFTINRDSILNAPQIELL